MYKFFTPASYYYMNSIPLLANYYSNNYYDNYLNFMPFFGGYQNGNSYYNKNLYYNNTQENYFGFNFSRPPIYNAQYNAGNYIPVVYTNQTTPIFKYVGPEQASTTAAVTNPFKSTSINSNQNITDQGIKIKNNDIGHEFIKIARKYSNCSESNRSHLKFCINRTCKRDDPLSQEWCTDFVTYVVKEAYKNRGKSAPDGFGSHDVEILKKWAISNNYFIRTSNKPKKGAYISQNIKPGDIIILNENNASHTGFVTSIEKNTGVIRTIEGNRDDMVKEHKYSPNNSDISGFIRLTS